MEMIRNLINNDSLVSSPLLHNIRVFPAHSDHNLIYVSTHLTVSAAALSSILIKEIRHMRSSLVAFSSSPIISYYSIIDLVHHYLLFFLNAFDQEALLSHHQFIFSKDQSVASSSTLWLWERVLGTSQLSLALWILKVRDLAIVIDVNRDLDKGMRSAEIAEHFLNIKVELLTGTAEKFEAFNSCNSPAI